MQRLVLTPALSPGARERGLVGFEFRVSRRACSTLERGARQIFAGEHFRAPSPGGAGWGEGGSADSNSNRSAFTLIEILIAVAAFAIVLAAINTIFYTALRLRNSTTAVIEKALPLEHAFGIIKRDLANLTVPGGTMSGTFSTTTTSNSVVGQMSPSFYTTGGVVDETSPFGDLQRVSYLLVTSTNKSQGRDLVRSISRNLLPALQDQNEQERLLGGVETLTFMYHDGLQWRDTWDPEAQATSSGISNGLPVAVKVQIQLAQEEGTVGQSGRSRIAPIELVVPIVVQQRTNQAAATTTTTAQAGGGQ